MRRQAGIRLTTTWGLPGLRPFVIARDEYLGALVAADDVSVDGYPGRRRDHLVVDRVPGCGVGARDFDAVFAPKRDDHLAWFVSERRGRGAASRRVLRWPLLPSISAARGPESSINGSIPTARWRFRKWPRPRKSRFAGLLQSPLTDSNRRPPPYHGGFGASRAYTRDHSGRTFSCKSP
jgi:hypothetical protein